MSILNTIRSHSQSLPQGIRARKAAHKTVLVFGRILGLIIALLVGLPVILLPFTTAVPAWVFVLLAAVDMGLIILQFRFELVSLSTAVVFAGFVLVSVIAVVASQIFAATPPIRDANGQQVPGSIATLEKVEINGTEQWITIRGHDTSRPILLHLGMGGPGGGGFATRSLFEPLEKDFVVVAWDEPGTGKSYKALPIKTLTPRRFFYDAYSLTL